MEKKNYPVFFISRIPRSVLAYSTIIIMKSGTN